MAPSLTSNSFLLTTPPRSKQLSARSYRLTVFAKGSGPLSKFSLGKKENGSEDESYKPSNGKKNFFFDLSKINPDMKSLIPVVSKPASGLSFGNSRRKDGNSVFVAGATGQAGVRIAQTLLRKGFTVRAAVPDLGAAQELARLAAAYKIISAEESKRLNAVASTFSDSESIAKAMGNATKVVVTVGPSENGPSAEVTLEDALLVVRASQLAGANHVAIIYDGTTGGASSNNVLNGISSFFNNFFSRAQSLNMTEFVEELVDTNVNYTLIKTKLTEDYSLENSYNVVISNEGTSTSQKSDSKCNVSTSQIASLVADVFTNTAVAENKVVEVSTDPSAALKSTNELFSAIPEDGRRKAKAEALTKAKAEEEAIIAAARASEASEAAKKLTEEVQKLSEQEARASSLAKDAKEKAEAAGASMESFMNKAKGISSGLSWDKLSSQIATAVQNKAEDLNTPVATVRGQAKARNLPAQKAVVKQSKPKAAVASFRQSKPKVEQNEVKKEERKIFGGLFKQETIYMDD
ncbi:hypothetical protein C5167_007652 [Papaver somniferum]|uniref:protein PLASTID TRANSCRIPTIONALLY ACTIVE 16, chloroplastic-like n=1 Tax=Papaver somniferum TaxID=3469 RepID=UPI000E701ED1|nr:protein PLASTID TRANSCRIPTIONALLY ACTIVE 16, chloroplastic-like [Papaver somniferum]RZC93611.1 hypothetical protein C5167_007652 [Papaver somniferum]